MNVQQKSIGQLIDDLKESKALGQLLLDNADEAHFFYSMEGKLIYVSPAFEKITGYTAEELYQKNFIPYIHPDDQEWTMKLWEGLYKGELFEDVEYRIVKKDGEMRWNSSSWKIVLDTDGRQIGIQGKQQDITQRKLAEQQWKESEQYSRILFEESTIGLALCRMNGELVDINPAYASIIGRTVEETMKLSYWDITPEKYAVAEQAQLERLEKTGRYGPYEKEYKHADGHLVPVRLSGQILEKDSEKFIWSSVEDITGRKQAEQALQRSDVLERLATCAPLNEILTALVMNAEKYDPTILCSVLLLDAEGRHLRHGAAPNLPDFYNEGIDGVEIGPEVGSCGAAAYLGERVIVEDIKSHPNWAIYQELPGKAGLRSCWSEPVLSSTGNVLGTFAVYGREPRAPMQSDLDFIQNSARLAAIAIEHRRSEEALKESEQKYRNVVENIGIGVALISPEMEILALNTQLKQWFPDIDVSSRPICYKAFNSPPRATECSYCVTKKTLVDGQVHETVTETPSDGKIINYRIVSSPIKDESGKVIAAIEMVEDITARKQVETELRKLSCAVEQSPASILVTDTKGIIEYVNPKFTQITGYSSAEAIGQTPRIMKSGKHPAEFYKELWATIIAGKDWRGEFLDRKKNGETFWENALISPVFNEKGEITNFLAVKEDITERKQAENALRNMVEGTSPVIGQDFFRILVKHLASALGVNHAFVGELTGLQHDTIQTIAVWSGPDYGENFQYKLTGTPCENVVDKELCCYPQGIRESFPDDHLLFEIGAESYIGVPLSDSNGKSLGILAVLHDKPMENISLVKSIVSIFAGRAAVELERQQAQEQTLQLLQQNRDLTQRMFQIQEQERRYLSRELHDEFGQWLTALRLHTQVLDKRCSDSDPAMQDSIRIIDDISAQMLQSIRKLINQLKPGELDEFGLKESLLELVHQWQKHYQQTHCALSIVGDLEQIDDMTSVMIYRVIQEGLTNVAKHAGAKNVSIQIRRNRHQSGSAYPLFLSIQDDGEGINPDPPVKGVGLAGMRERVLSLGGEFTLNSSAGEGVRIEALFPATALKKTNSGSQEPAWNSGEK